MVSYFKHGTCPPPTHNTTYQINNMDDRPRKMNQVDFFVWVGVVGFSSSVYSTTT